MKVFKIVSICAFLVAAAAIGRSDSGMMSVQVKQAQLRATPSFLGTIIGPVGYGDQVEVLQQQGEWTNVKDPKHTQGWIHQSALTSKKVVLRDGGAASAATGQEIALAGKGFNSDVESRYRSAHGGADYASVDRMEAMRVSPDEMIGFLREGDLKPEGGAR